MFGLTKLTLRKARFEVGYIKLCLSEEGKSSLEQADITFYSEPIDDNILGQLIEAYIKSNPPVVNAETFCGFATFMFLMTGKLKLFMTEEQFENLKPELNALSN